MQPVTDNWRDRLQAAGFRNAAMPKAVESFERASAVFAERCSDPVKAAAWWVPGRIEVLGKHTDYGGGRSLVCPVERGIHLIAAPRSDRVVRVIDASSGSMWTASIRPDLKPAPGEWFDYPITVTRRIARDFSDLQTGMDLVFLSSIPRAAGLSSSSALVVASFLPLAEFNRLEGHLAWQSNLSSTPAVAGYLGAVENGLAFGSFAEDFGVGTHGGSEDHTAILCGRAEYLSAFHYLPVTFEHAVRLPDAWCFAVASSGASAAKAGAVRQHYNALSGEIRQLLELWKQGTGSNATSLFAAMAEAPDMVTRLGEMLHALPEAVALTARLEQFREECEVIIPGMLQALAAEDVPATGALVDRSQHLAEQVLRNQIPETIHLARHARILGAPAASAFGGGFGGSVWALVPQADSAAFLAAWKGDYCRRFPDRAARSEFFTTRPGPGASRLA